MLVLDDVARLRQRVAAPRGVIALSALAVLLVDPLALHSVGAWLSVSAIAAVIWAGRATAASHWGVRAAARAAAATLLTAPITAYAFGTVAPIGVLANLIAIPLGAIVVPGLVVTLALSWVVPGLAALLAAGSGLGLALLDLTAQGAAAVPGGHVIMVAGWEAAAVWLAVAAAAGGLWNSPRRRWRVAGRGRGVQPRAGARARRAARPAAVPRVSRGGRGVGGALAPGAGRRSDRGGRGGARGAEPGQRLDDAAARRQRARRGAAGHIWCDAPVGS